ncbi:MAG: DUF4286 family protein [Paludibacter sp.]|jgi:Domain of unknown function (DUF4286)
MLIFNTTYKVATKRTVEWQQWINESHIPFMLNSGEFSKPQVAKVIGSEDDGGVSFSVQFHIVDMNILMSWHQTNATDFQNNCSAKFGEEVVFFTTVLELID